MITAAFSLGLIFSALAGIPVGRILDHRGPRSVMTVGAVVGAAALVAVATATNLIVFTVGWVLAGTAMATTFYQAAFAALTRWYGPRRVRALTTLTLAGGLASTVFAPLTAALAGAAGWRHTYLILSVTLLLVAVPLHWFALRGAWAPAPAEGSHPQNSGNDVAQVARSKSFTLLAAALTLSGFAMYAVVFGLIPLLLDRGVTPAAAAWALGLGGLGQTLGRLVYVPVAKHTTAAQRTTILVLAGAATTILIAVIPGPTWLLLAAAIAAGTVRGNLTLLQATAVTDRWGTTHYARLTALLSAPITIAAAIAPWAGSALAVLLGNYRSVFVTLATISVFATAFAHASGRRQEP
jgi:MFS family permease